MIFQPAHFENPSLVINHPGCSQLSTARLVFRVGALSVLFQRWKEGECPQVLPCDNRLYVKSPLWNKAVRSFNWRLYSQLFTSMGTWSNQPKISHIWESRQKFSDNLTTMHASFQEISLFQDFFFFAACSVQKNSNIQIFWKF